MFELHLTGLVTTSLSRHGDETDPEGETKADLRFDCVFIQEQCNNTLKYTVCYLSFVKQTDLLILYVYSHYVTVHFYN